MTDLSGTFGWGVLASWVAPSWACGTKITPCLIFTLLDLAYNLCVFHPIWEEACTNLARGVGKGSGKGGGREHMDGYFIHSFNEMSLGPSWASDRVPAATESVSPKRLRGRQFTGETTRGHAEPALL